MVNEIMHLRQRMGHYKFFIQGSLHPSWSFAMACVGVVVGVIVMNTFKINILIPWWWMVLALSLLIISFVRPRMICVVMAFVAGLIIAFMRTSLDFRDAEYVRQFYGQTIEVTGSVDGDSEVDEGTLKLKLSNLRFGEKRRAGVIFVSLRTNSKIERGDNLILKGKLGEGFGTYIGSLYRPKILKWEQTSLGDLSFRLRNWFAERIAKYIPDPEAGLGLSYLLGIKNGLTGELEESLRTAGLAHIVVTSGTHLAILVGLVRRTFGKLSRFFGILVSVIFVIFFMSVVGFSPSITRAGIMTILALIAWYGGRKLSAWRIILIVAAITLLINPTNLVNLGWQLSFVSYAGVTILAPRIQSFFFGKRRPGFIGLNIVISISATLMTLPIVLFHYGQISLLFPITNLIITPTLPYVMGAVLMSGVLLGIPLIEKVASFVAMKMLNFHIVFIGWFGKMRQFLVEVPKGQAQVFLIYGLIVVLMLVFRGKRLWHNERREQLDNP